MSSGYVMHSKKIFFSWNKDNIRNSFNFTDKNSFLAYALHDGTIGVYRDSIRLWRIKVGKIILTTSIANIRFVFQV